MPRVLLHQNDSLREDILHLFVAMIFSRFQLLI